MEHPCAAEDAARVLLVIGSAVRMALECLCSPSTVPLIF